MPRHRRRRAAAVLSVLVALALLAGACTTTRPRASHTDHGAPASQSGSAAAHPNIVFVLTDDLSANLLPYMPNVQALARRGTSFSNYYVVDSLCCPSRSAIFTGQYPHDNGVFTNTGADGGYATFTGHGDATKTFAYALQHGGDYLTGMLGKYLNGYEPVDGVPPGWSEWDVAGRFGYGEYDYDLNQNGLDVTYGHDPQDYLTDVLSQRAQSVIDTAPRSRPFALEIATFAPHLPAVPAPQDAHTFTTLRAPRDPSFDRIPSGAPDWLRKLPPLSGHDVARIDDVFRRRVRAVQAVDRMVGALEQRLTQDGLADDTYFVFSSDNGFHLGNHRLLPGKQTAFDTDIRVPLIVAGPGVPAGRTVSAMTSSVDLAPTFAAIAGVPMAGTPDGVSLLDLWHGAAVPAGWQKAVLVEHHGPDFDRSDPDVQPIRSGDPPTYEAMRTADGVYVEYVTGEREYYDTRTDPYELNNLAARLSPTRLAVLHAELHAFTGCHGATSCQAAARL